jgi:hypothetical protein
VRFAKVNTQGDIAGDCWEKIYSTILTEAATSLTISSLAGNTDKEYKLITRVVNGYNGACNIGIKPNNDGTAANYGIQGLYGGSTTAGAYRLTSFTSFIEIANFGALNQIDMSSVILYAKSGYVRTALIKLASQISTTTVNYIYQHGQSWNNTTDEITSLVIASDQTNGLGIGTVIELWKKADK